MTEIRIKIGKEKYFIWNTHQAFGEETTNEDLWFSDYGIRAFGYKYFGRVLGAIASKR